MIDERDVPRSLEEKLASDGSAVIVSRITVFDHGEGVTADLSIPDGYDFAYLGEFTPPVGFSIDPPERRGVFYLFNPRVIDLDWTWPVNGMNEDAQKSLDQFVKVKTNEGWTILESDRKDFMIFAVRRRPGVQESAA